MPLTVHEFHAHVIPWDTDRQILDHLRDDFPIGSMVYGGTIRAHDIVELPTNEVFMCDCSTGHRLNPVMRVLLYVEI